MRTRKVLLIILGILILVIISIFIYDQTNQYIEEKAETNTNINVAVLSSDKEQSLGTIIYSGTNIINDFKSDNNINSIILETPDSLTGAANIYYQDLLNRYKNLDVDKKQIKKDGALNNKATEISCKTSNGKIAVTVWQTKEGKTQIEIKNDKNYH